MTTFPPTEATNPAPANNGRSKGILFLTIFVAMLGLSVLFPIIAPLARQLGLSETQAGWFSTAYSLMQFIFSPIWGARSEKVGRKPILIMGLVGFSLSFGLFGLFAHLGLTGALSGMGLFGLLVGARFIGGMLSSATLPTAQAMMADLSDTGSRTAAMGMIGAAFGLGVVFGPGLGAVLSTYSLTAPIYFSSALGLLTAVMAYFTLPETRKPGAQVAAPTDRRALLSKENILLFLGISALTTLASVGMEQTIGFYVQDILHITPAQTAKTVGGMLAIFGIVAAMIQGGAMRTLSKRLPPTPLLIAGLTIMGAGMFLLPIMAAGGLQLSLPDGLYQIDKWLTILTFVVVSYAGFAGRKSANKELWSKVSMVSGIAFLLLLALLTLASPLYWHLTAALAVIGIGSAILSPTLSAALSLSVPDNQQGTVAGLNSSALALGRMTGPLIGTALYQKVAHGAPYMFSGAVLMILLGVVATVRPKAQGR